MEAQDLLINITLDKASTAFVTNSWYARKPSKLLIGTNHLQQYITNHLSVFINKDHPSFGPGVILDNRPGFIISARDIARSHNDMPLITIELLIPMHPSQSLVDYMDDLSKVSTNDLKDLITIRFKDGHTTKNLIGNITTMFMAGDIS